MKKYSLALTVFTIAMIALVTSCKKSDSFSTAPEQAHFANQNSGTYFVTGTTVNYKVPVGLTTVSSSDRTVNIAVTSPTGAVEGTHYTVSTKSLVIPAGKALDSITVQGVFSQYLTGRKDTLIFAITDQGAKPAAYNDTFRLFMRGPCFASDVNTEVQSLKGTYANTTETLGTSPYGPYTTTISSITQTSATTANIVVTNIYDDNPDWNPLTFTLDWSTLSATKITLAVQNAGSNAGNTFGATYNGMPYLAGPVPASMGGAVGTFDFCAQKLTLKMQMGIQSTAGPLWYTGGVYTVNMAR